MHAVATFVVDGTEDKVPFECESVTEAHERVAEGTRSGIVTTLLASMFVARSANVRELLDHVYSELGGEYVTYTLDVDGEKEVGIVDVTPPALGEHHYRNVQKRSPELESMVMDHVVEDCGNPACPVRAFYEELGIADRFRAPDHPGQG